MRRVLSFFAGGLCTALTLTPTAANADDDPYVGNATGGGWTAEDAAAGSGQQPPAASAKAAVVRAFDQWVRGAITEQQFRRIEEGKSQRFGLGLHIDTKTLTRRSGDSLRPPPCDPGPCAPTQKILDVEHRAQINNYFCGPATGVMIANYRGVQRSKTDDTVLNQVNMANDHHMDTADNGVTRYSSGLFTTGLNHWLRGTATGYYTQYDDPSTSTFRQWLRYDILDDHPFGVSTVEQRGELSYNGHNTANQPVGHWIAATGYRDDLDKTQLKDPATSVWGATLASISRTTNSFVTTYVDNGISG